MFLSNLPIVVRMLLDRRFIRFIHELRRKFSTGGRFPLRRYAQSLLDHEAAQEILSSEPDRQKLFSRSSSRPIAAFSGPRESVPFPSRKVRTSSGVARASPRGFADPPESRGVARRALPRMDYRESYCRVSPDSLDNAACIRYAKGSLIWVPG